MTQAQRNQTARNARTARGLAVSRVAAGKKFGRYKPEKEKATRKADVKEDEVLRQMKKAWTAYEETIKDGSYRYDWDIDEAMSIIQSTVLQYSSKDVEKFSIALAEFQDEEKFYEKAGMFLSVLINNGKDSDYIIHTSHLVWGPNNLGCRNRKNIIVKGKLGSHAGREMEGGTIIVEGDVDLSLGFSMKGGRIVVKGNAPYGTGVYMEGGTIIVEGNAGDTIGSHMKGGTIIIKGNAGSSVGPNMDGGTIIVEGDAGDYVGYSFHSYHNYGRSDKLGATGAMEGGEIHILGDVGDTIYEFIKGGKIYHKGKLIVNK